MLSTNGRFAIASQSVKSTLSLLRTGHGQTHAIPAGKPKKRDVEKRAAFQWHQVYNLLRNQSTSSSKTSAVCHGSKSLAGFTGDIFIVGLRTLLKSINQHLEMGKLGSSWGLTFLQPHRATSERFEMDV